MVGPTKSCVCTDNCDKISCNAVIGCRDHAVKVWEHQKELEQAGVKLVCVVHEWIEREINAYSPAFWPGELYHDVDKAFYKVSPGQPSNTKMQTCCPQPNSDQNVLMSL